MAIAVLALGGAAASFIIGNILFGLLILLGAFALMLAGSARHNPEHTYALSEKGLHIDQRVIVWDKIEQFAIREGEPNQLVVDTKTLPGIITIPLITVDYRAVRTELKNNNVEETDILVSPIESIVRALGL